MQLNQLKSFYVPAYCVLQDKKWDSLSLLLTVSEIVSDTKTSFTHPSISIVFFHKLAIVVVVKCWVALHPFLLTKVVVLSLCAVHSGVHNLSRNTVRVFNVVINKEKKAIWSSEFLWEFCFKERETIKQQGEQFEMNYNLILIL